MINNVIFGEQTQISIFPSRTVDDFVIDIEIITKEIQSLYLSNSIPFVIGYSGGKDSSAVVQLIWNAISKLSIEERHKKIYVMTTDTQVENPLVSTWVKQSLARMKNEAKMQQMPVEPYLLHPEIKDTFWACLIGKGYPAPRQGFRWCTERLKITPTNHFIRQQIRENGEVILMLGTRKAESNKRASTMNKYEINSFQEQLNLKENISKPLRYSGSLPNAIIYSPLEDWRTDEVWMYLMQWENPWGGDNKELLAMYRGATADNECPLVVDTSTPSCGDSRFGCWVCTMVNKDKSMEAMIQNDEEKEWLQPLLDLRNELDIEDDRPKRDFRRIFGKVQLFERNLNGEISIEPIPGPYTKQWREYWLRRVLEAQESVRTNAPEEMKDITLITTEELSEIRRIWREEKHEFDDQLPKIYKQVTGETFQDPRPGADNNLLGSEEWDILADICAEDSMHLELLAKLIDTERQYFLKISRKGIYKDLEKCFESSSRSKEEAIENARYVYDLKNAAQSGNIAQVKEQLKESFSEPEKDPQKQLTWASMKFPTTDEEEE
ncbi:MAG: DNA phosphorothioation system sulfurtransferase DndC [Microcystis wesenbergii Mw_QC_S_20081001_S30D]|jgi:DNA sulfur modification protein DndC|uniref:DNA phosphorothioation system sulfurtransferase DndC n=1 Tax=Microcystis wesenbergii Mw_QC_S_20081001_S30D TaxID=2486245 RepID=A0A552JRG3_9CHRO|nr:DNA phosphorothioation system sulfurtransferase DndC [Microcystis aeruginosa W11-03]NCR95917.1 DNA phosphorothioation system sulfurtransferase DndC [Microcystis aeruginosa W11-06]TRU98342.1 MAG: DNA phosphorothioation system sulfurtransferase DndC [Microcystis wesenbergii Mw_QC_S_20081001_S30D]TRV00350.1 MAG: DNA phosphorothioation system sulfurtransferase DndC [Microcystis wesenbergii Mw_QC_B_20070930_S4D]TRV00485.1 MAG: DNA phosphorothioation system sulfurtransferase DndC [Microcystis wese